MAAPHNTNKGRKIRMPKLNRKSVAQRRARFLSALARGWSVSKAASIAGYNDNTAVYTMRDKDESFAKAWDAAIDRGTQYLEDEVLRRATDGEPRKKFNNGAPVIDPATGEQYVEYEKSDVLAMFLLKGRNPRKYRDNVTVESTATVEATIKELAELVDRQIDEVAARIRAAIETKKTE